MGLIRRTILISLCYFLLVVPARSEVTPPAEKPQSEKNLKREGDSEGIKWLALLKGELQKYWKKFQKEPPPRVYYMLYGLYRQKSVSVSAEDGVIKGIVDRRKKPNYSLRIEIRVGDYKLDSSGREGFDWQAFRHLLSFPSQLPQELKEEFLKKRLWQLTDVKYKEAKARYHRKKYIRNLKVEIKDKSGDFTKEKPVKSIEPIPQLKFSIKKWKKILKKVSKFSLNNPRIIRSSVSVVGMQTASYTVDSAGSEVIKHKTLYQYVISVTYLSPNKEHLSNSRVGYVDREDKLPSAEELAKLIQKTVEEVVNQGNAPEGVPSEAPAILMPDVAGVLFHEALGHRLEAQRMLREDDGRTFRRKVGQKILPPFLSLIDDPLLPDWMGIPLNGHYKIDDQMVPAQKVVLIKNGVLKGFLMSRKPIDKFQRSNGHGRAAPGREPFSRMGNLIVLSEKTYPFKVLKKMLLEEAKKQGKPYAFIIARASGGYTHTATYGIQSFKNHPKIVYQIDVKTGKSKLVKGLEIIGTPLTVINNIIATGDDYGVFNGFCGAESGWVPVSAVAPSLLLKTIELQRFKISKRKFYLLPPPPGLYPPERAKKPARKKGPSTRRAESKGAVGKKSAKAIYSKSSKPSKGSTPKLKVPEPSKSSTTKPKVSKSTKGSKPQSN